MKRKHRIYKEGMDAMNKGQFYFAAQKFAEAENIMPEIEQSSKAFVMSGFCYYSISFMMKQ